MQKAVLFLIFNRIDSTQKVFEQIKIAKPPRLYIASDGARNEEEKIIVENIRKWVLDNIDWPCEVKTLFRDENLGCRISVKASITWFFEQESDGIILEDDCLPNQSFFRFCEELLDKYKDNKKIWHITGFNPLGTCKCKESYYFAKVQHCWGWASWADRWKYYEFELEAYNNENVKKFSSDKYIQDYWLHILKQIKKHEIDCWAYQWAFTIIEHDGLCINPCKNLVSNIGNEGVHFKASEKNNVLNTPTEEISEIVHPKKIEFNHKYINLIYKKFLKLKTRTIWSRLKNFIKKMKQR